MARKKADSQPVTPVGIAYKSVNQGCYHAGVYYAPGELLPAMPLHCLNLHIGGGNVEMVEVDPTQTIEAVELTPETVVEIIDQVSKDDPLPV
jgi:hypothetical protein